MRMLYPTIKPYHSQQLKVSETHSIYVEEVGSPTGIPVVFVHGGPGAGCSEDSRRFFDPSVYRIVLFDQRGAGRSEPYASLEHNTTQTLVEDMETIRQQLGIEKWLLFGGSWGSTLSLVYAQSHPNRVSGLILRGIFLGRQQDLAWFYQAGASYIYPDHWQHFIEPIPEAEREDLIDAYYRRLIGDDEIIRMGAAKHWSEWEGKCATLSPNKSLVEQFTQPHAALGLARIEAHYFKNKIFLEDNQILKNIERIKHIPGIIVHGRYDMICTMDNAYALHQAWPASELQIICDAGHSSKEPGILDALIQATDRFSKIISG
jgi:proline iminopeptidase